MSEYEKPPIEDFLALVSWLCRRPEVARRSEQVFEDLQSAGHEALVRAYRSYSPDREANIHTWISWNVRWAISDELRKLGARGRLGVDYVKDPMTGVAEKIENQDQDQRAAVMMASTLEDRHELIPGTEDNEWLVAQEEEDYRQEQLEYFELMVYAYTNRETYRLLQREREARVLRETFLEGKAATAMAQELGVTQARVSQIRSGFRNWVRKHFPDPR